MAKKKINMRSDVQMGKYDDEILKALLKTGNHLQKDEIERARILNKKLRMAIKERVF